MTTTEQQCLTSVNIADYKYHQILRPAQKDVVIKLRRNLSLCDVGRACAEELALFAGYLRLHHLEKHVVTNIR